MADLNIGVRALDRDGVLVLDITDPAYELVSVSQPDRRFRRSVVTAEDVEGDVEVQRVLDSAVYELELRVKGSTTALVETRRAALLAAVEARSWRLEITLDGVVQTWLARSADTATGLEKVDLYQRQRPMVARIPVQPRTIEEMA